jgi:hypothetical protein
LSRQTSANTVELEAVAVSVAVIPEVDAARRMLVKAEMEVGSVAQEHAPRPPTPTGDPVADLPEPGVRGHALHGLDRGPAHEATALFGDPSAVHGGVGLVVFRGSAGP